MGTVSRVASLLAETHIEAQRRLREITKRAVAAIWADLPGYDRENVDEWLSKVVPVVLTSQRAAVARTEACLAQAIGRQPLGVNPVAIIGGVRGDTSPDQVYERPFVTLWTKLGAGVDFNAAVSAALERATSSAATDVQMAMRDTLREVGEADDLILGYQRVPDGGACQFCQLVSGQRYRTEDLMPIHNNCGCGGEPITGAERPNFTGRYDNDLVTVREHGELGPVLTDPHHDFTTEAQVT